MPAVAEKPVPRETPARPTFEWDGWDLVREVDPAGVETVYYAPRGEILSFKRGSSVYQVHADVLGSVREVTDSSGATVAQFDFDAWGIALGTISDGVPGDCPARYVGAHGTRRDHGSGLYYVRQRWYDPDSQRFISRDPARIVFSLSTTEYNSYAYANDRPHQEIDVDGLQAGQRCRLVVFMDANIAAANNGQAATNLAQALIQAGLGPNDFVIRAVPPGTSPGNLQRQGNPLGTHPGAGEHRILISQAHRLPTPAETMGAVGAQRMQGNMQQAQQSVLGYTAPSYQVMIYTQNFGNFIQRQHGRVPCPHTQIGDPAHYHNLLANTVAHEVISHALRTNAPFGGHLPGQTNILDQAAGAEFIEGVLPFTLTASNNPALGAAAQVTNATVLNWLNGC